MRRRGFTVVELIVVLVFSAVVAAMLVVVMSASRPRIHTRRASDASQIRNIVQALHVWTRQSDGTFTLPSRIDAENSTVADVGAAKDTTANIFSMMIFTGMISPEMCISPAEANTGAIARDDRYEYSHPAAAVDPAKALWDPAFKADFTGGKVGNVSYAHLLPSGPRLQLWRDTFTPDNPVLGNRGPQIASAVNGPRGATVTLANPASSTLLIHGGKNTWEGNIAYSDGHVAFEQDPAPADARRYRNAAGRDVRDVLFYDEPDDPAGTNAFLGIFTTAGDTPAKFTAIWD